MRIIIKSFVFFILCLCTVFGDGVDERRWRYIYERCEVIGLQDTQYIDKFYSLIQSKAGIEEVESGYKVLHGLAESDAEYQLLKRPIYDILWARKTHDRLGDEVVDFYLSKVPDSIKNKESIILAGNDISYFLLPSYLDGPVVISQNFLFDKLYRDYIGYVYEVRVDLPSDDDLSSAIKCLVNEFREPGNRVVVKKEKFFDKLNQKLVFDLIKANEGRRIFIDEKYLIEGLHSLVRPHGFFLEICSVENPINEEVIDEDSNFWDKCEKHISSNFHDNQLVLWIFAENRCMSAGVYAAQGLYTESESAFRQAVRIAPDYWKPYFRICNEVFIPCERYEDALSMLDNYLSLAESGADDRVKRLKKHVQDSLSARAGRSEN